MVVFVLTFTFLPLLLIVYSPSVSVDGFVSGGLVGSFTGLELLTFLLFLELDLVQPYHKHWKLRFFILSVVPVREAIPLVTKLYPWVFEVSYQPE